MTFLTTVPKISNFMEKTLVNQAENWLAMLIAGDIKGYEQELFQSLLESYNYISEMLLPLASSAVFSDLKQEGHESGGRKIELRPLLLKIGTGHSIEVESPYVKQVSENWQGPRHLLAKHWSIIGGATPGLYDKVGYCSGLSPSYDIAHQTLSKFGVEMCLSSVRDLTNHLAGYCFDYGEEKLSLKSDETLAGKRVVIATDGGRTRTRDYDENVNDAGRLTYQTPWREPKLFVIDVLDDQGRPERYELPIYGCRFEQEDMLNLLGSYLKKLEIDQAAHVQILADGAPWIWNHLKPLLIELKVDPNRITESLDYYHASQYVHNLVENMPKRVGQKNRKALLTAFKELLWEGKSDQIVLQCRSIYRRPGKLVKRWINYLEKHQDKTQYATYQHNKLMCGSGIIESGVRRIINLRFKNAATFWKKEIVEKLFFLRAALLTKRWNILIDNLVSSF